MDEHQSKASAENSSQGFFCAAADQNFAHMPEDASGNDKSNELATVSEFCTHYCQVYVERIRLCFDLGRILIL